MSKKGENIYKRKDGRWEGRYIKARNDKGKIIYGYVYAKKYSIVKKKLQKLKYIYTNNYTGIELYEGTVSEWLTYWLDVLMRSNIKISTYSTYHSRIQKYISPFLGEKKLTLLKAKDIEEFISYLKSIDLSSSSIHSIITVLKIAMNRAFRENYILIDPCRNISFKKETMTQIGALTIEEQKKIEQVAFMEKECSPIILALYTGMRIGEISALKWEDVDFEKEIIYVKKTLYRVSSEEERGKTKVVFDVPKTHSSIRSIPIAPNLKSYLLVNKERATSDYVVSCKNSYAEPRVINYRFKKVLVKADVKAIRFHALRHTFATRCVENGIDIATLSKLLGHSSIKMTLDTYTDSLWENRKQAMNVLDMNLSFPKKSLVK